VTDSRHVLEPEKAMGDPRFDDRLALHVADRERHRGLLVAPAERSQSRRRRRLVLILASAFYCSSVTLSPFSVLTMV
jgi:hypothetical protein